MERMSLQDPARLSIHDSKAEQETWIVTLRSDCRLWLFATTLLVACLAATTSKAQPGAPSINQTAPANESISVTKGAPAPWVDPRVWSMPSTKPTPGVPAEFLLIDSQDLLGEPNSEYYHQTVVWLQNAEGVRRYAEWSVEYAPEYQSLAWHAIRVHRSGEVMDRLPKANFRVMQREQAFEQRMIDGRITVATVLEDIRVGDVVEVAYTLSSGNPALKGHLSARHYLGSPHPVRLQLIQVRAPLDKPIKVNFFLPDGAQNLPQELFGLTTLRRGFGTSQSSSQQLFRWRGSNLPAIPFDESIAPRASPYYPMVGFSSFATWTEVAEWARGLFSSTGPLPESAKTWAKSCAEDHKLAKDRLESAVAWVQQEVRYFALAIGAQSLKPRSLPEICSTRFGDCKDKSALLVALLRELGIEAWPALANTMLKDRVQEFGPSPFAFDHAIVVYRLDGRDHWIDPTLSHQGGGYGTWAPLPYRTGLVLREDQAGLQEVSPMGAPAEPDSITEDFITVAPTGDAILETTTRLSGGQADRYRHVLASTGRSEISLHWFNYLNRYYRSLEDNEAFSLEDDPRKNFITLKASYRLPKFMVKDQSQFTAQIHAYTLRPFVDLPETRRRRWPYALPGDRFIRHRIVVELPFELAVEQQPLVVATDELVYRAAKGLTGQRFVAEHELRFARDHVPAQGMQVFVDSLEEIQHSLSTLLRSPVIPTPSVGRQEPGR